MSPGAQQPHYATGSMHYYFNLLTKTINHYEHGGALIEQWWKITACGIPMHLLMLFLMSLVESCMEWVSCRTNMLHAIMIVV